MDDDDGHEGFEDLEAQEAEFRSRKTVRQHDRHHCIKGRGREEDCWKTAEEEQCVPETHLDYTCMRDEKEGQNFGVLGRT